MRRIRRAGEGRRRPIHVPSSPASRSLRNFLSRGGPPPGPRNAASAGAPREAISTAPPAPSFVSPAPPGVDIVDFDSQ